MADQRALDRLHDRIADHAAAIEEMFTDPVKVTIIVRNLSQPDSSRDVLLTNERDTEEAFAAARRVAAVGIETPAKEPQDG